MNKNFFYLLISGITGVSVAVALISNVGVDALRFGALRADYSVTLLLDKDHAAVANTDFGEATVKYGDSSKATQIHYSSAKKLDNGLCVLANGATIQKANNAPSKGLSSFEASGTGTLEIKTSFDANWTDDYDPVVGFVVRPYVYKYTLGQGLINIVGNYFKITAVNGDANINSIRFGYDCNVEDSLLSNVRYTDGDNYVEFAKTADYKNLLKVKLTTNRALIASDLTMRNSDNEDEFCTPCTNLEPVSGGYIATFSLDDLNNASGSWTQYSYVPRIYVNNKRVDGTDNGNIHANGNISSSIVKNAASDDITVAGGDRAYKLKDETWGLTLSWINNLRFNNSGVVTNKGMRLTHIGINKTKDNCGWFPITSEKVYDFGTNNNYFLLEGYVETESEAIDVMNHLSSYELYSNDGGLSTTASPHNSYSSYESWPYDGGGYKINLWFNLSSYEGHEYAIGLRYNGIPYILRDNSDDSYTGGGANNSGLIRTQHSIKENTFKTDWRLAGYGVNGCSYRLHGDWGWIWIESKNTNIQYTVSWSEDWIWKDGAKLLVRAWNDNGGNTSFWLDATSGTSVTFELPVSGGFTGAQLVRCSSDGTQWWNKTDNFDLTKLSFSTGWSGW